MICLSREGFGASPGKSPHLPKTQNTIPAKRAIIPKRIIRVLQETSPASAATIKGPRTRPRVGAEEWTPMAFPQS